MVAWSCSLLWKAQSGTTNSSYRLASELNFNFVAVGSIALCSRSYEAIFDIGVYHCSALYCSRASTYCNRVCPVKQWIMAAEARATWRQYCRLANNFRQIQKSPSRNPWNAIAGVPSTTRACHYTTCTELRSQWSREELRGVSTARC